MGKLLAQYALGISFIIIRLSPLSADADTRETTFHEPMSLWENFEFPQEGTRALDTTQLDSFIMAKMDEYNTPGVAAVVEKDNQVIWEGYYGYANISESIPVTDSTIFYICSVSKLFSGTAIMQLWENGLFALDDDVNDYLTEFQVVNPFYPEIGPTFRQLLTHTSSIYDNYSVLIPTLYWGGDSPVSLEYFLENYLAPGGANYSASNFIAHSPGTIFSYCNVGMALLGYLVEQISGIPFNQYTRDSIFTRLNMESAGWFFSEINLNNMTRTYSPGLVPYPYWSVPWYPAAIAKCSARNLSQFLLAIIQGGEHEDNRILENATVDTMTANQFVVSPDLIRGLAFYHFLFGEELWLTGHTGTFEEAGATAFCFYYEGDSYTSGVIILTNNGAANLRMDVAEQLFAFAAEQNDTDDDGIYDIVDNCIDQSNPNQEDIDEDGVGDICDNCLNDVNQDQADADEDSVGDACDNCPNHFNPGQEDGDDNGVGDVCDYVCGDANNNGDVNILDVTFLISYLYKDGQAPDYMDACDVNNSGMVNILDVTYLISYLYKDGPELNCPQNK